MTQPLFVLEAPDQLGVAWAEGSLDEANWLLRHHHYLGPIENGRAIFIGYVGCEPVAAQVWRQPTSRWLPPDTWLELARWCLTPAAGLNAGSRQHAASVRIIRRRYAEVTTLVSYSDPGQGHTGSLYRACNWQWAPTWLRLRPPPSGNGNWGTATTQSVKDRWVFPLRRDADRAKHLCIRDRAAVASWIREHPDDPRVRQLGALAA